MKVTIKALRRQSVDRLLIESVDLSLYIAHAEYEGERRLIVDKSGRPLKTRNLIAMKSALAAIEARERLLIQRSPYDEMVGHGHGAAENLMEIRLGAGYEALPSWQH